MVKDVHKLAVTLALNTSLAALQELVLDNSTELSDVLFDILLYVPEICTDEAYMQLIELASKHDQTMVVSERPAESVVSANDNLITSVIPLSPTFDDALLPDLTLQALDLPQFLQERVRRIDQYTGQIEKGLLLLKTFSQNLADWRLGIVRPLTILHRLGVRKSIPFMESLDITHAIAICIGGTSEEDVEQILEDVLFPWAKYKGVFDNFCSELGIRLGTSPGVNLRKVLRILSTSMQSEMSLEHRAAIASGAMLACYQKPLFADGRDHTAERQTIVAILQNTFKGKDGSTLEMDDGMQSIKSLQDFDAALVNFEGRLHSMVIPSPSSIAMLQAFIDGSGLFGSVAETVLLRYAPSQTQLQRLHELFLSRTVMDNFKTVRSQLLRQEILNKITNEEIEVVCLRHLLREKKADVARQLYITAVPRPLASSEIERAMLEVFHELFDNATSISRKELGPISQVLNIIHPKHASEAIRKKQLMIDTLIELSAYRGALDAQPLQIKNLNAKDTILLFSRVLQEPENYKKHFRLLGLYQNLCLALGIRPNSGEFYALAANAALFYDDLAAALKIVDDFKMHSEEDASSEPRSLYEGELWRLLYQVCRYPSESHSVLEKQLALIGDAVAICPVPELHQTIVLFRRLEQSLADNSRNVATRQHNDDPPKDLQTTTTPPTFERQSSSLNQRSTTIEMPQWRLFEAAQAATRTAREYLPRTRGGDQNEDGRIRKRDQLAGLVGSSVGAVESKFTSGLGWIRKMSIETVGSEANMLVGANS